MGNLKLPDRHFSVGIALLLIVVFVFPISAAAAQIGDSFSYPLKTKSISKGFVEPAFEYGPGHRGVSFFAKSGTPVFASADGEVIFAGKVAGALHVTISHGKNFKTTYTNLATKTIRLGDRVTKAQLLGTTASGKFASESNTFLFTMRYKGKYVDPMKYLVGDLVVRDIHLGEFPKQSESLIRTFSQIEKKAIEAILDSVDPVENLNKFAKYFVGNGLNQLKDNTKKAVESYNKAVKAIKEMKDLADKIARDSAVGIKGGIDEGIKKLKRLEATLIKYLRQAFRDLEALSKEVSKQYARALEFGNKSAVWFLEIVADVITLPFELSRNLALLATDLLNSAGTTTLKILNQYATYDIPAILRQIVIPGSCLIATCSKAIVLKCNPKTQYEVRTSKQGYKGSGNSLMVVAGLGSHTTVESDGTKKVNLDLSVQDLGYERSEVQYFSYASDGREFDDTDTYKDLNVPAKSMDMQIREFKRNNPGKKLDLTSHSLGGTVLALWLAKYYDPTDSAYPDIGKVVMLAPPTNGTALANGRKILEGQRDGNQIVESVGKIIPRVGSESVGQVDENGYLSDIVNEYRPLAKVEILTIRLARDPIVTAATQTAPDANEIILPSRHLEQSHSAIVTDTATISTMQHFLEGTKPPCPSISDSATSVAQASLVRSSELFISRSARDWADTQNIANTSKFLDALAS